MWSGYIELYYFLENIMNMTRSMKTVFATVAVCTAIIFASIATVNASDKGVEAMSCHQQEHKHRGDRHEMKRMAKFLSLSQDQKVNKHFLMY